MGFLGLVWERRGCLLQTYSRAIFDGLSVPLRAQSRYSVVNSSAASRTRRGKLRDALLPHAAIVVRIRRIDLCMRDVL